MHTQYAQASALAHTQRTQSNPSHKNTRAHIHALQMRITLRSFAKYVPPDVVRLVMESGHEALLGGERKQLTVCVRVCVCKSCAT